MEEEEAEEEEEEEVEEEEGGRKGGRKEKERGRRKSNNPTLTRWGKSKSTVYPQKQTRTDVSGHASGAVFRCASFIKNVRLYILIL